MSPKQTARRRPPTPPYAQIYHVDAQPRREGSDREARHVAIMEGSKARQKARRAAALAGVGMAEE
jgi:hypothetical protein